MSEALEVMDAAPEIIQPEQAEASVPDNVEAQSAPEAPKDAPKERVEDPHWKAARARMDEQARENRLQKRQLELMQQEVELLRRSQPKTQEPDEEENFTETEKKLYREIKTLKAEVSKSKVTDTDVAADRLRAKYSDFDDVMSPENIEYLHQNTPALAKALQSLKDNPYEQGLAAYDALRKTEFYQQRHTMQDKAKIEENSKKPVSINAVKKQGALSDADRFAKGLTPDLKKVLLKEMAEARKGA